MSPTQRAYTIMRPASQDEQDVTENWRAKAACIGHDPEMFFQESTSEARKVCGGCPVKTACLQDALDTGDTSDGFRGGHTARQRRFLIRGDQAANGVIPPSRRTKSERTRAAILERSLTGMTPLEIATDLGLTRGTVWSYLAAARETGDLPPAGARSGPRPKPIKHGTRSGYYTHKKRDENPCDGCRGAVREFETQRRAARKAAGL